MPTLLVIDDNEDYRDYLTMLLTRYGFKVRSLATGIGLDKMLATQRFDAAITDLYMPNVDGLEVVLAIKRYAPILPVIGLTGGGESADICSRAMMAFGAEVVLTKPLDPAALFGAVERALKLERLLGQSDAI